MRAFSPAELSDGAELFDCWNRIGWRGDKSCPELASHAHCRNCPSFSAAARFLLDRGVPGAAAERVAFNATDPVHNEGDGSLVVFRIGSEWFALSILVLDEIVAARPVHSLPHRSKSALTGIVNVRGEQVPCLSLSKLLGDEAATPQHGRLVVLRHPAGKIAFPVDEMQQTQRYRAEELKPVPATLARSASGFTRGLLERDGRTIGCLDEVLILQALARSIG